MKRIHLIIAVIMTAHMVYAQHYIGVGASLSSPLQLDKSDVTRPLFGVGEGITLQYQYRYEHFLMSIGASLSGEHPRVGVADETFYPRMTDTRGIEFSYLGSLISRRDLSSTLWFHTPVMVGFETYPFYMMAGAQYSLSLVSWTHQTGRMAAAADYSGRYYDDYIDDMFTHGYHDYQPVSTRGRMKYKNDIRLLVELGGTVQIGQGRNRLDRLMRIGAFAEIGMMNVLDNPTTQDKTEWDVSQYMNVSMNHVYSAANANTGSVRNIVVGVKVTCLFPAGEQPKKYKRYKYHRRSKRYRCRCIHSPYRYY